MAFRKLREKTQNFHFGKPLIPVIVLVALLAYNVLFAYNGKVSTDDDPSSWFKSVLLLIGAAVAAIVGYYKCGIRKKIEKIGLNLKDTTGAILILLWWVLSSTWILSGIIPTIIYVGITITQSSDFSAHCLIIFRFDCIPCLQDRVVYFCYGGHCHDWH